jgi:hypothetical protein
MSELIVVDNRDQNDGQHTLARADGVAALSREMESSAAESRTVAAYPSNAPNITLSGPVAVVLNSRMLVITLMLVAGPIGLPALWFSPRFSRTTKALFTLGFFLVTAVLPLVGAWYAFEVLLRPVADAIQKANGS